MNEKDIVTWLNGYAEGILFAISRIGPSGNASKEEVTGKQTESKPEAINSIKLQLRIIESQLQREWGIENKL